MVEFFFRSSSFFFFFRFFFFLSLSVADVQLMSLLPGGNELQIGDERLTDWAAGQGTGREQAREGDGWGCVVYKKSPWDERTTTPSERPASPHAGLVSPGLVWEKGAKFRFIQAPVGCFLTNSSRREKSRHLHQGHATNTALSMSSYQPEDACVPLLYSSSPRVAPCSTIGSGNTSAPQQAPSLSY